MSVQEASSVSEKDSPLGELGCVNAPEAVKVSTNMAVLGYDWRD
jgi:hypothetical protein